MSFTLDLEKFAKKANANAVAVVKKTAISMFSDVIIKTPVDEGRARGNWQITFDSPAANAIDNLDKTGQFATAEVKYKMNAWQKGDIWLTNNLPYIRRLEYGWSQQAPNGMVRLTVREFRQNVEAATRDVQ